MNLRIEISKDPCILASLNQDVQDAHVHLEPASFKPYHYETILEDMKTFLRQDGSLAIVAWDGDTPIGYAMLQPKKHPDTPYRPEYDFMSLDQMSVRSEYRRQGIGTRLIEKVMEISRERGIRRIELTVWTSNSDALHFYEHMGFNAIIQRQRLDF